MAEVRRSHGARWGWLSFGGKVLGVALGNFKLEIRKGGVLWFLVAVALLVAIAIAR
jgi:hypothetical protein